MFSSQSQALAHYKGTKHAKKLKALDAPKSKLKGSAVTKETANQDIAKGINTSQVPNGADRKGLCFPACCTFPNTCAVLFSFWSRCSYRENQCWTQQTHIFGNIAAHNMQSLYVLEALTVDYINPVSAALPMAGCRLSAHILNL